MDAVLLEIAGVSATTSSSSPSLLVRLKVRAGVLGSEAAVPSSSLLSCVPKTTSSCCCSWLLLVVAVGEAAPPDAEEAAVS